ncbi:hypothetical protein BGZ76_010898, partial [Entomortierella beljakovae]
VRMVERRSTGKVYALKYINKEQVIQMEAVRNILRERQILESVDHTFVVNMRFAFQDDDYMYMCMDLMMGGDLRFHMNRRNFGEDVVRFWIAEISSAIVYLHSLGIVHRDIKPDNILLDAKGHAHITDFNISCKLTTEKPYLTSQSGTVAYMAPEVFKGTGYGTSVDWWALGVIFYECIYGRRPFLTENIGELKRAISSQTIEYPLSEKISPECVYIIQNFLKRDPAERLGAKGGMDGIKQQPFFAVAASQSELSVQQWWHLLEAKKLTPKFQPPSEAANFDATYDLEELLLDEDPLSYRSTRNRARRLQKEKDEAIRQENAKRKAEQDAVIAANMEAQAVMEAMNRELEKNIRKIHSSTASPRNSIPTPLISKKKSVLQLFGGDSSNKNNVDNVNKNNDEGRQPTPQAQPPPASQNQSQKTNSSSQASRQTQFQSIPLSPIDPPNSNRDLSVHSFPALRFPPSVPDHVDYTPTQNQLDPTSLLLPALIPDNSQPLQYNYPPTPPKPQISITIEKPGMNKDTTYKESYSTLTSESRSREPSGPLNFFKAGIILNAGEDNIGKRDNDDSTQSSRRESNQLPVDTPSPLMPSALDQRQSQEHNQRLPFEAAHPQKVISSPVIIPTPLDHSVSRHKHIPTQQPQAQIQPLLRRDVNNMGLRRPVSPSPAVNIAAEAAAAAAMADMSEDEKFIFQLELIDREFTTFDYTVFESYHGLVDPVTMSVGDPPEWVRSRD